jgi:hypothetical protein
VTQAFDQFTPSVLPVTFDVSNDGSKYVGDGRSANQATFTFTPPTKIQLEAGSIDLITPIWYEGDGTYPF